jgi:tRNA threonylcarbamoyladenosine biosynthesis protein TsaE
VHHKGTSILMNQNKSTTAAPPPKLCGKLEDMDTHILKEGEWENFIQEKTLPLIAKSQDEFRSAGAFVFALVGDLGAGKTTFSKIFLKELGVKQHVQSPTFSIINSYDISHDKYEKVFHIDVYRIEDIRELEVLHVDEIFSNPKHLVLIEWADKVKAHIPQDATWIYFEHDTTETRKVTIKHD